MTRSLILAAAILPTLPAIAQNHTPAAHGAIAGRSPIHAYKAAADADHVPQMHSLPAGKLPVYGRHAMIGSQAKPALAQADAHAARTASR